MKSNRGYITDLVTVGLFTVIVGFVLMIVVALAGFPGGIGERYSEGTRIGVVNKLSNKGVIFKSYEAEATMSGLRKGSDSDGNTTISANLFSFNVDPQAISDVTAAMESGKPVKLVYREWFIVPVGISNSHVVYRVESTK